MSVFNCGAFLRRRAQEKDHRPSVGLLHEDGTLTRHYLDVSQDRWCEGEKAKALEASPETEAFLEKLAGLGEMALDFGEAVERLLREEKPPPEVEAEVRLALEERSNG